MTRKRFLTIIVALVAVCASFKLVDTQIEQASWILGIWENKTSKGTTYESWKKISNLEYNGRSYSLKEMDTAVFENIQLIQKHNGLFYIPNVKGQNNNLPVSFSLKTILDNEFVFENPVHDFPQFISYRKISEDSLVAEISGKINGNERNVKYPMKRIR